MQPLTDGSLGVPLTPCNSALSDLAVENYVRELEKME